MTGVHAEVPHAVTTPRQFDERRLARRALRRVPVVLLLALGLFLTSAGTALAGPVGTLEAAAAKPGGGGGGGGPQAARGYDISWPQCSGAYPSNAAFGIVGVNRGIVFSTNECLVSQIAWAGGATGELYVNTANPGPALSSFWPAGQVSPQFCDPSQPDTAACAYDYGWNAASYSWQAALAAYDALEITVSPAATTWWLDVETSNSWREGDLSLNVAALRGQLDYLRSVGVAKLGFYSTTLQWGEITGGTTDFAAYPSWGAGAPSERVAKRHCQSTPGFTGGDLALVQYPWAGFDADLRC